LGLCGAPFINVFEDPIQNRLDQMEPWLDHIQSLGANAILLGPVFLSSSHGYDVADYYQVDRRLGDIDALVLFSERVHQRGIHLVLDAVFNHVARAIWAFRDLVIHGEAPAYQCWFYNLRFGEFSPKGDPFTYESWNGHFDLLKLNLSNPAVRAHLFDAVAIMWMGCFDNDGLRLDTADCIDLDFLRALSAFTHQQDPDFWLMGEVVHGDYRQYVNPETIHAVTNYECYKGSYSSLADANYFEIAHGLNRQFGDQGIYQHLFLYNFVDNHDVDRVASKLGEKALLYPLYILLLTMPGIPSIYYGSEWGIEGKKANGSDAQLRPVLDILTIQTNAPQPDLPATLCRLASIRKNSQALLLESYSQLFVAPQQFAFLRQVNGESLVVVLNSASQTESVLFSVPWETGKLVDILNPGQLFTIQSHKVEIQTPATWGRILQWESR
jgi:glycosidase